MDNVRFYLTFEPRPVPADGLYAYQKRSPDGRQLDCWRIGEDNGDRGKPVDKTELHLTNSPQSLQAGARHLVPINRLLFETSMPNSGSGEESIFISLELIDTQHVVSIYKVGALAPPEHDQGVVKYELPVEIRRNLWWLSEERHETIYCMLAEKFQSNNPAEPMRYNATPCWLSLKKVSRAMIDRLTRSLISGGRRSYDNRALFSNPDWIFQLHRIMVEGVAEGHEDKVTKIEVHYDTHPDSTPAWKAALDEAEWGWTWDNNNRDLKDQDFDAHEAILNFALWYRLGWCDELVDWIVPGETEAQEYCFLRMHYAHWYCNLLPALIKYGEGDDADWQMIYDIIMHNFASSPDSADEFIVSLLIRLADTLSDALRTSADEIRASATEVTDWATRARDLVIDNVMTDLRNRARQT